MFPNRYSDTTLSLALALSAAAWGLYWIPLRAIETVGISGSWSVAFFNACPLIVLCPLLVINYRKLVGNLAPTIFASLMIGAAFTFYANGLVETTVVRATLLFYLTPVWSTILGVLLLSERLTKARIIAIVVAFLGLLFLVSNGDSSNYPLNKGDLYGFLSGIFWAMGATTLNRWSNIPTMPLATLVFIATTLMSAIFASLLYADPVPDFAMLKDAFPAAAFWSIILLLPSFCIIFKISRILFPGRVGILMMSEVIVAIITAAIFVPEETMTFIQWMGAFAIILAGLIEVIFGYTKND